MSRTNSVNLDVPWLRSGSHPGAGALAVGPTAVEVGDEVVSTDVGVSRDAPWQAAAPKARRMARIGRAPATLWPRVLRVATPYRYF